MGYRFSRERAPVVIMDADDLALRLGWDLQWEHEQGLSSEFVRVVSDGKVESLARGERCVVEPKTIAAGGLYVPRGTADLLGYFAFGALPPLEVSANLKRVWEREGPREWRGPVQVCWEPSSVVVWFRDGALPARLASALLRGTAVIGLAEPIRRGHMRAPEPYIATSAEFAERVIA